MLSLPSYSGMKRELQTQDRKRPRPPPGLRHHPEDPGQTRRLHCCANFLSHQRAPANPTADPDTHTHTLVKTDDGHQRSHQPGQEMAHCHRRPLRGGGLIPSGRVGLSPGVWTFQRLLRCVAVHASWVPTHGPWPSLGPASLQLPYQPALGAWVLPEACLPSLARAPSLRLPGSLSSLLKRRRK